MIRSVGHKPANWPAMVLIFGWLAACLPLFVFNDTLISQFPRLLPAMPLAWWPHMDFVGFALTMSPLLFGAVALWFAPRDDGTPFVGLVMIALALVAFALGIAWCLHSGVAIYPDRVVYREPGFGQAVRVERFEDIRRVEVSCVMMRQRRSWTRTPEATYDLVFASGYRVDIWPTPPSGRDETPAAKIDRIRRVARAADAVNAVHAPLRRPDGSLVGDVGCVPALAKRLGVSTERIAGLLSVDLATLKPGEYRMRPQPITLLETL